MRYGHFRFSKTGILDDFFDLYRREGEARGIPFLTWIENALRSGGPGAEFQPELLVELLVDRIMRRE